jgi:hypothetical protein
LPLPFKFFTPKNPFTHQPLAYLFFQAGVISLETGKKRNPSDAGRVAKTSSKKD